MGTTKNNRVFIGYKDRGGTDIKEGDIVEFFYSYEGGSSPVKTNGTYSKMVDIVAMYKGQPAFFCDLGIGAHAWRYNKDCKVIGNIWDSPEMISTFSKELFEKLF